MTRTELEHVIRAAATISEETEIIVVGSQAILGCYPDAPPELCVSSDVDLYGAATEGAAKAGIALAGSSIGTKSPAGNR